MNTNRVPPQNADEERAVLGAIMLPGTDNTVMPEIMVILSENDFYKTAHKHIYKACLSLFDAGDPIDLITVMQKLEHMGKLNEVGGTKMLDEMMDSVPTVANASYYAKIVKESAMRRQLIRMTTRIYHESFDDTLTFTDTISAAETGIMAIREQRVTDRLQPIKALLKPTFSHVQALYNNEESVIGLPTGFLDLDELTSGFQPGDYALVAGRPSMGKSTLVQNIVQYIAIEHKVPALIFTLEMASLSLTLRFLACESGISFHRMRKGHINEGEWPRVTTAAGKLAEASIHIDDTPGISIAEIRAKSHQMKSRYDIGVIVVDYLQLIGGDGRAGITRSQEVDAISQNLKAIGRTLNVPVIACSQLSRQCEAREDKRPKLSDLRESGGLEQDADIVLFLYREKYYDRNTDNTTTELIIGKQRNGPVGTVMLGFDPTALKFLNLAKESRY